jgi:benzoyl-CoA reductase/2-hydroxyglutaryl-CoA dehydratase subunit BcrC/BadD/HgdB
MSADAALSQAFAPLQQAYAQRLRALTDAAPGRTPLVGVVGNTVPLELIHASGARALRLAPLAGATTRSDAVIESFSDPEMRHIVGLFLDGALDGLALLVIPRSSETWHKLFLALREVVRTGLKQGGPPLLLFDVLHTQRESSRAYGLARTRELAAALAALTGRAADASALREAITRSNQMRLLLQQLQALRLRGQVTGEQAQVAAGARHFMAADEALQALRHWLQLLAAAPPQRQRVPHLFVHGVPLEHAGLHTAVDQAGAHVVMESDDWGSGAGWPLIDVAGDPLSAVFEHVWRDVPCARTHPAPPPAAGFLQAHARGDIQGLILNMPRPDDVVGWQFPQLRDAADAAALPWTLLRDDLSEPRGAAPAQLASFVQRLCNPVLT